MSGGIVHLIDGTGVGGAERFACLLSGKHGRLVALRAPLEALDAPGGRIRTLRERVDRLLGLRAHALVAHDPATHEAAALAGTAGGPPVIRVMHTSRTWTPDDHRRAFDVWSPATSLYLCVEEATHRFARRKNLRSRFLPQAIDPRRLRPRPLRGIHTPPRLLFVGRLEWAKGADVLIRAMSRLPRSPGCRLTLAGDGPERETLADLAHRLGIWDRVRFIGYRPDAGRLYPAADAVIIPSRGEGGSLVALESMACGTPVIGSAVGGLKELMRQNGLSWCLVRPEEPRTLALAIRAFCADSGKRFRAFAAKRAAIRARHDAGRISEWVERQIHACARR